MMIRMKTFVLCAISVVITACGTVKVSTRGDTLPGIPFYIKKEVHFQETTWSDTLYIVNVKFTARDDKKKPIRVVPDWDSGRVLLPRSVYHSAEMTELRLLVLSNTAENMTHSQANTLRSELETMVAKLIKMSDAGLQARASRSNGIPTTTNDLDLVSNKLVSKMVVNADDTYYINGRHPAIGTGKANFEFRDDMTLTKADTEVTDSTLSTLLGLLPITEFFIKQWALTPDVVPKDADIRAADVAVKLSIDNDITIFKITRQLHPICTDNTVNGDTVRVCDSMPYGAPMSPDEGRNAVLDAQLEVSKPSKSKGKKGGDDSSAYKFEGKVAIPKPKSEKK